MEESESKIQDTKLVREEATSASFEEKKDNSVACIGISFDLPGASTVEEFWNNLINNKLERKNIPEERWNNSLFLDSVGSKKKSTVSRASFISASPLDFDPEFFKISPKEAMYIDPQHRMLLIHAWHAIEDSSLKPSFLSGKRVGVYIGQMTNDYISLLSKERDIEPGYLLLGNARSMAANRISWFFNFKGPSITCDTACSSSLTCVDLAFKALMNDDIDYALVGGVNYIGAPEIFVSMSQLGILSSDGQSKSFQTRGDGYGRGEGCIVTLLTKKSIANLYKTPIYSIIVGAASNHDGFKSLITDPLAESQSLLIDSVYNKYKLDKNITKYVECHGTGTQYGDKAEIEGILGSFMKNHLYVGSLKPNIGHLEGAAGLSSFVKSSLILYHKTFLPISDFQEEIINFKEANKTVLKEPKEWESKNQIRQLSLNSFGIGASNTHLVMQEFEQKQIVHSSPNDPFVLILSGHSKQSLELLCSDWITFLTTHTDPVFIAKACTQQNKKTLQNVIFSSCGDANSLISSLKTPTFFTKQAATTCFIFSGQGTQYVGMGKELFRFPVFRSSMEKSNQLFKKLYPEEDLLEIIFGNDEKLHKTWVSQPAITAIQIALCDLWDHFDVKCESAIGHSSGELAACYASKYLSHEDTMKVALYRGYCLENYFSLKGKMITISLPKFEIEKMIQNIQVEIACINTKGNVTVSGCVEEVDNFISLLKSENIPFRELNTTIPYHNSLLSSVKEHIMEHISDVQYLESTIPFYSTIMGKRLTKAELKANYWVENLVSPVLFPSTIEDLLNDIPDALFLECSPHNSLSGAVKEYEKNIYVSSMKKGTSSLDSFVNTFIQIKYTGDDNLKKLDFDSFIDRELGEVIQIPKYHFHSKEYSGFGAFSEQFLYQKELHPYLGFKTISPVHTWENFFETSEISLRDHKIGGSIVFPAAGYIEMALQAHKEVYGIPQKVIEIKDIRFKIGILIDSTAVSVFSILKENHFSIYTTKYPQKDWILNFSCQIKETNENLPEFNMKKEDSPYPLSPKTIFQETQFGPRFQRLESYRIGNEFSYSTIMRSEEKKFNLDIYEFDAAIQTSSISNLFNFRMALPIGFHRILFKPEYYTQNGNLECFSEKTFQIGKETSSNFFMLNNSKPFLYAHSYTTLPLNSQKDYFYHIDWKETETKEIVKEEHCHVIFAKDSKLKTKLVEELQKIQKVDLEYDEKTLYSDIYYFEPLDISQMEPFYFENLLELVKKSNGKDFNLWIFTKSQCLGTSTLFGFYRVLKNEHPFFRCKMIAFENNFDVNDILISIKNQSDSEILIKDSKFYSSEWNLSTEPIPLDYSKPKENYSLFGNLKSFVWKEITIPEIKDDHVMVEVSFVGINFKDIMISLGYLSKLDFEEGFSKTAIGLEFSGIIKQVGKSVRNYQIGDRVAGLGSDGCFKKFIHIPEKQVLRIPDDYSMEEGAALGIVGVSAFVSLVKFAKLDEGETVLIHSAAGGVGLFAVFIAKFLNANIIATAGTVEKREYLKSLGIEHVFDSHSLDFVDQVRAVTNGKGVNVILNSLYGQFTQETATLLTPFGRFIEIGKRDIIEDRSFPMKLFKNNCFYAVFDLDTLIKSDQEFSPEFETKYDVEMPITVYSSNELSEAFTFLSKGEHIGKVVIKMDTPSQILSSNFYPQKYYFIVGCNGIGTPIAEWMACQGAKNLVLISRSGLKDVKLIERVNKLGTNVFDVKLDISDQNEVMKYFKNFNHSIGGIIHLAMVLEDKLIVNQNRSTFENSWKPKAFGALYIHEATQNTPLDFFITFSSISCVIGNPGQSNYSSANSYLETLSYHRKKMNLPSTVIHLGGVSDFGAITRLENIDFPTVNIFDVFQCIEHAITHQPVEFMFANMDWPKMRSYLTGDSRFKKILAKHGESIQNHPLVKEIKKDKKRGKELLIQNIQQEIKKITGAREDFVHDVNTPLATLGIDSLQAVELKGSLFKNYSIDLPVNELPRNSTIETLADKIVEKVQKMENE